MTDGGARELVVLGTSAQVPTRERNHNGYLLRWNGDGILFDPGEGTQRQLLLADASSSAISAVAITHLHGDHCLGLPGVLARFVLDQRREPVDLYYPASGDEHVHRLIHAAVFDEFPQLRLHPVPLEGATIDRGDHRLVAVPLEHSIDCLGWRLEEPARVHMLEDRLDRLGIRGPEVGRLRDEGSLVVDGRTVHLEEVSEQRSGQSFAFVMDTAECDGADDLAQGVDLLVTESTFLDHEADLAREARHLTARQAASIAARAGARRLVLTHYSARHPDNETFRREAADEFSEVVAAEDLQTIRVPPSRTG